MLHTDQVAACCTQALLPGDSHMAKDVLSTGWHCLQMVAHENVYLSNSRRVALGYLQLLEGYWGGVVCLHLCLVTVHLSLQATCVEQPDL